MGRRHELKTREIAWSHRTTYCYGGDTCDQLEPRWDSYFEGDKEGDEDEDDITLDPKLFPPGTQITISVPLCPTCDCEKELCQCGFDWDAWELNTYS